MRFRKYPVALVCDIEEMYLRIEIEEKDRPYHSFLWRKCSTDRPDVYQFNCLVFGVNSSPYEAIYVSKFHAEKNVDEIPMAAETVLKSTYMDDSMDSVQNEDLAVSLYQQLAKLWGGAGMHARKWLTNSERVMNMIPKEDRAATVDLDKETLPSVKTLGVLWVAQDDVFQFHVGESDSSDMTKRSFLSKIARLFDPLGLLTPFTIRGKIMMQDIWLSGLEWDEMLPNSIQIKAKGWFSEMKDLNRAQVPRCLQPVVDGQAVNVSLHTFVDASQNAYGACVYMRNEYQDGSVAVRLVSAKARVAPLASMSMPRLELMGAILGLHLTTRVTEALESNLLHVRFWCDSMNVLFWIRGRGRKYKTFVANRIGEIQRQTCPEQWQYVSTNVNPADLLTRGVTASKLVNDVHWWNGPEFLQGPIDEWRSKEIEKGEDVDFETRKTDRTMIVFEINDMCIEPSKYSDWLFAKRVQAWMLRFIGNSVLGSEHRVKGELSTDEIQVAENILIKHCQQTHFTEEYAMLHRNQELQSSSKLKCLNPILDEDGIMRSKSRLENAQST